MQQRISAIITAGETGVIGGWRERSAMAIGHQKAAIMAAAGARRSSAYRRNGLAALWWQSESMAGGGIMSANGWPQCGVAISVFYGMYRVASGVSAGH